MNRILSLQALAESAFGEPAAVESGQSNWCSSATTACSTQSNGCKPPRVCPHLVGNERRRSSSLARAVSAS